MYGAYNIAHRLLQKLKQIQPNAKCALIPLKLSLAFFGV